MLNVRDPEQNRIWKEDVTPKVRVWHREAEQSILNVQGPQLERISNRRRHPQVACVSPRLAKKSLSEEDASHEDRNGKTAKTRCPGKKASMKKGMKTSCPKTGTGNGKTAKTRGPGKNLP
jgi:hypothetical protein